MTAQRGHYEREPAPIDVDWIAPGGLADDPRTRGHYERGPRLRIVPLSIRDARAFTAAWHRHNEPRHAHKFSLGVATEDGTLVGVAVVGRPVARHLDDGLTLEVSRTVTDGTPNANSALYGAAWRATKALGYTRLVTYTQADEDGTSLRAAGWRVVAHRPPHAGWNRAARPRSDRGAHIPRTLWEAVS